MSKIKDFIKSKTPAKAKKFYRSVKRSRRDVSASADLTEDLRQAGIAAGADGVFLEIHEDPSKALSDGLNSLILNELEDVLSALVRIKNATKFKEKPV